MAAYVISGTQFEKGKENYFILIKMAEQRRTLQEEEEEDSMSVCLCLSVTLAIVRDSDDAVWVCVCVCVSEQH